MVKISVIIPCYNSSKTIRATLDSIFSQDFTDYEVIVVDDASTDNTPSIAKEYPINLISLPINHGPAYARNRGAALAKGNFLLFIDSDIVISNSIMSMIYGAGNNVAMGVPSSFMNSSLISKHFNSRIRFNFSHLKNNNITWGGFTFVKKSIFEEADGYNESLCRAGIEDNELGLDISNAGYEIRIFNPQFGYILHNKKISFVGLLKNDFLRTIDRVEFLFRRKLFKSIIADKKFISTPWDQLASPIMAGSSFIHPLFLAGFLATQYRYLAFLKEDGFRLLDIIKLIPILFIDMTIVFTALIYGTLRECLKR